MPSCVAHRVDRRARSRGSRSRRAGISDSPKPGQVERDAAVGAHEGRDVQQPVLPQPPRPCRNSSGGPSPPVSTTLTSLPSISIRRVSAGQSTRHPRARRRRRRRSWSAPGRDEAVAGAVEDVLDRRSARRSRVVTPCASRSTSTPRCTTTGTSSRPIAKRRFGVDLPYEEQLTWGITQLRPEQLPRLRRRDPPEQHVLAAEPYPGAVETIRALARGRALHPHHLAPRATTRTTPTAALARRASACPYDELYCSFDKVARCVRARDRRPDRRLAGEPAARPRKRVSRPPRSCTRGTASCARTRTSSARRTGRRWRSGLEPVLA